MQKDALATSETQPGAARRINAIRCKRQACLSSQPTPARTPTRTN